MLYDFPKLEKVYLSSQANKQSDLLFILTNSYKFLIKVSFFLFLIKLKLRKKFIFSKVLLENSLETLIFLINLILLKFKLLSFIL